MDWRRFFRRLVFAMVLICGAVVDRPAEAYIERDIPLVRLMHDADFIVIAKVEQIDLRRPSMLMSVRQQFKGKMPFVRLPVLIRGDEKFPPQVLLDRVAVDHTLVIFILPYGLLSTDPAAPKPDPKKPADETPADAPQDPSQPPPASSQEKDRPGEVPQDDDPSQCAAPPAAADGPPKPTAPPEPAGESNDNSPQPAPADDSPAPEESPPSDQPPAPAAPDFSALGFTNGTWVSMIGYIDGELVRWVYTHPEPHLRRTFAGTTAELLQTMEEIASGRRLPPPVDKSIEPGLGPRVDEAVALPKEAVPASPTPTAETNDTNDWELPEKKYFPAGARPFPVVRIALLGTGILVLLVVLVVLRR